MRVSFGRLSPFCLCLYICIKPHRNSGREMYNDESDKITSLFNGLFFFPLSIPQLRLFWFLPHQNPHSLPAPFPSFGEDILLIPFNLRGELCRFLPMLAGVFPQESEIQHEVNTAVLLKDGKMCMYIYAHTFIYVHIQKKRLRYWQ